VTTGGGWNFPDDDPYDEYVGPFPCERFVADWMATVGAGNRLSASATNAFLPLVEVNGLVTIAAEAGVTDYHSPLGGEPGNLVPSLLEIRDSVKAVVLDSLPPDSFKVLQAAFEAAGATIEVDQEEAAAVITVAGDYLEGLSKKQRHEVRRKERRFTELIGAPELEVCTDHEPAMDRFVEIHRLSGGGKGQFITAEREEFFRRLYASPGWEIAELSAGGSVAASLFGYRESNAYYLYNSAYHPDYREASPGVVALYKLIELLVSSGCRRIDLLKGDEIYKFRMGAKARPLHRVSLR
jgi:CelD/BcsL family acetyltransferase involved in cellulose biosynthesis